MQSGTRSPSSLNSHLHCRRKKVVSQRMNPSSARTSCRTQARSRSRRRDAAPGTPRWSSSSPASPSLSASETSGDFLTSATETEEVNPYRLLKQIQMQIHKTFWSKVQQSFIQMLLPRRFPDPLCGVAHLHGPSCLLVRDGGRAVQQRGAYRGLEDLPAVPR